MQIEVIGLYNYNMWKQGLVQAKLNEISRKLVPV